MRVSAALLLALPALALAQQQIPFAAQFQQWVDKAKTYLPNNPLDGGAAKVAAHNVKQLSLSNWRSVLSPSPSAASQGPEEWLVLLTGSNKTCVGQCGKIEAAFNKTVALLSAEPNGPKFAMVDCENNRVLCHGWMADVPSVWHILLPQPLPDQSKPATTLHVYLFNTSTVEAADITKIVTEETWRDKPAYEGAFHPFDGWVSTTGLSLPMAYVVMFFATVPSWLIMVGVSFFSRSFMSRRMAAPAAGGNRAAGGAAGGAPPAGRT